MQNLARTTMLVRRVTTIGARRASVLLARRCCSAQAAREEYSTLQEQIDRLQARMRALEVAHPEVRSSHARADGFYPPKLHHINIVSARGSQELLRFYHDVMRMDEMPVEMFPRTTADGAGGSDVPINFTTDGHMQMHLATQDLGVAHRSGHTINPIGVGPVGHIAYRTDDIDAFKAHLDKHGVQYSDYGTRFAKEWHQIFFLDPVGTIVEVHAVVA